MTYELAAYRVDDDQLLVTARETRVLVDRDTRRPVPIPDAYQARLRAFEGTDVELAAPA